MKKIVFTLCLCLTSFCYTEEFVMHEILKNGIEYYFEQIIPTFYAGTFNERKERNTMHQDYKIGMQGAGGGLHFFMETENLIIDFYYRIEGKRQDFQAALITAEWVDKNLYEYWIFKMSDHGTPYNYAYFYITKAESKESKREILNISRKYVDSYVLETGKILDFTIYNPALLYSIKPQLKLYSFAGTKYENAIVTWRSGKDPYIRKMNCFEWFYYNCLLKKSKRDL